MFEVWEDSMLEGTRRQSNVDAKSSAQPPAHTRHPSALAASGWVYVESPEAKDARIKFPKGLDGAKTRSAVLYEDGRPVRRCSARRGATTPPRTTDLPRI